MNCIDWAYSFYLREQVRGGRIKKAYERVHIRLVEEPEPGDDGKKAQARREEKTLYRIMFIVWLIYDVVLIRGYSIFRSLPFALSLFRWASECVSFKWMQE